MEKNTEQILKRYAKLRDEAHSDKQRYPAEFLNKTTGTAYAAFNQVNMELYDRGSYSNGLALSDLSVMDQLLNGEDEKKIRKFHRLSRKQYGFVTKKISSVIDSLLNKKGR